MSLKASEPVRSADISASNWRAPARTSAWWPAAVRISPRSRSAARSPGSTAEMSVLRKQKPPFLHDRVALTSILPPWTFAEGDGILPREISQK
jgi:hypothetical protein